MQSQGTFTGAGWDFVGEDVNGVDDVWKIREGVTYPQLSWRGVGGDVAGGWRVDMVDLAVLRIAMFELSYRSDVPHKVVLNEAIELAKDFATDDLVEKSTVTY